MSGVFAYCGLQGHGKTYEVVKNVLLPALARGRRVVTNIAGLDTEKIQRYIEQKYQVAPEKQGIVLSHDHEAFDNLKFFPEEKQDNTGRPVQPGDLVIIDECWRWMANGEKLPAHFMKFMRMHRHFVHEETGLTCAIVLITQSIVDLQRKILIEKSFLMTQHVSLGLPDRYIVQVYAGRRQNRFGLLESHQHKYDPEIFPLYSSHSQKKTDVAVKQVKADRRGNIFNMGVIKWGIPLSVVGLLLSFWYLYRFFHPEPQKPEGALPVASSAALAPQSSAGSSPPAPEVSVEWRLAGFYQHGVFTVFVLTDGVRQRFIIDPPSVRYAPGEIDLTLPDGQRVTRWSGPFPQSKDSL